jgi:hypothetical protein
MSHGGPVVSPYVYDSGGDFQGNHITITVVFNDVSRALTSATVHRDAGCVYTKILIGIGADGTPNTTTKVINVGNLVGDRSFTPTQMAAVGLNTIDDILSLQITAGS